MELTHTSWAKTIVGIAASLLLAALLLSCSAVSPIVGKRYLLAYGVTIYVSSVAVGTYPNLSYPDSDATSVGQMFAGRQYNEIFTRVSAADGNFYVNGASQGTNASFAPTRANLVGDLAHFAAEMTPADTFVLYYSGHGMQTTAGTAPAEYIVPYGAVTGVDGSGNAIIDSTQLVSQDDLAAMLNVLPAGARKIVILDSCNSGGFIGNTLEVDRIPSPYGGATIGITPEIIGQAIANFKSFTVTPAGGVSPYGNTLVIAGSGANESNYEGATLPDGSPLNHGVMTYYLLQAAQFGDLNGDGVVSVDEAYALVKAGIDNSWNSYYAGTTALFEVHISGGPVDYVLF